MSKIYEALQYAQMQKEVITAAPPASPVQELQNVSGMGIGEEMLGLYKMIDTLLAETPSRIIQFVGCRGEEGTSTIVREFAKVCAYQIGHSVLLLDADRHNSTQSSFFGVQHSYSWIEALKSEDRFENAFHQVETSSLFISPSSNSSASTPEIFNSPNFENLCAKLRDSFDFIIIDSAPFTVSPDVLAISSKIDGVVLVVEAEKTRWQTVKRVSENITRVGGKILGIVLNKRRYFIPERIYKYI